MIRVIAVRRYLGRTKEPFLNQYPLHRVQDADDLYKTFLTGGEGGIRTLGTGLSPYDGLANR